MTPSTDEPQPTILVDCRWLGMGGVGRVTQLLLSAWQADPPQGRWLLWGPVGVREYLWPGAAQITGAPRALPILDQLRVRSLPHADLSFFLHQIHPVPATPYVTVIHDTTPLRWGGSRAVRLAKNMYLRRLARGALQIITVSAFSAQNIVHDLDVAPAKVEVLTSPENAERSRRVRDLRRASQPQRFTFFVGRFAPHKNVDRLIRVFPTTAFARRGGRLVLVGGEGDEAAAKRDAVEAAGHAGMIDVRGVISDAELDELYATAAFLTIPSFEEGYGLPAFEALSVGLPVCLSSGGALAEIAPYASATFNPRSNDAMRLAIDAAANGAEPTERYPGGPELADYGRRVAELLLASAASTQA